MYNLHQYQCIFELIGNCVSTGGKIYMGQNGRTIHYSLAIYKFKLVAHGVDAVLLAKKLSHGAELACGWDCLVTA